MTNSAGETIGLAETTQPAQNQLKICVHIRPTDRFHSDALPTAPTGRWHLKFEADKKVLGDDNFAQVWIPRDDSLCGYPRRGRQSYFEHPDYIRFDKHGRGFREDNHPEQAGRPYYPIKRKTLVNVIVTGDQTFTASGYVVRDCDLARYSAGGKIRSFADDRRPDVLLPSEDSLALPGVLAAGNRSGSVVWMSGTSVAAPQLARHIVNIVSATGPGEVIGRPEIKDEAQNRDPCPAKQLDPDGGGWGRLERVDPRKVKRT